MLCRVFLRRGSRTYSRASISSAMFGVLRRERGGVRVFDFAGEEEDEREWIFKFLVFEFGFVYILFPILNLVLMLKLLSIEFLTFHLKLF